MYAVIEDQGRQYKVAEGERIEVDLRDAKPGDVIEFDRVLFWSDDSRRLVGAPILANAKVRATVEGEFKGKKTISFKFHRRGNYRRKVGHRQRYMRIRITEIVGPEKSSK